MFCSILAVSACFILVSKYFTLDITLLCKRNLILSLRVTGDHAIMLTLEKTLAVLLFVSLMSFFGLSSLILLALSLANLPLITTDER